MASWFAENIGTIGVTLLLMLVVVLIVRGMVKDRKAGNTSCGNRCAHCPMSAACHRKK